MTHCAVFAFPSSSRHISALPQELLEEILIIATALGFPTTAAAFAQTCRAFHKLVYQPFHNHLWREMFLEVFDDPRPSQAIHRFGCAQPAGSSRSASPAGKGKAPAVPKDEYPWKSAYQSRIWTAIYIRRRTTQPLPPDVRPSTSADLQKVAETLLSVITTAEPLPSTSFASLPPSSHTHPIFPPLSLASRTQPKLINASLNIAWLTRVLARGFPPALSSKLLFTLADGRPNLAPDPAAHPEDVPFHRLLAQTGLAVAHAVPAAPHFSLEGAPLVVPVPEPAPPAHAPRAPADAPALDYASARRLARIRTYNVAYLHRQRFFGPFLPADPADDAEDEDRDEDAASPVPDADALLLSSADAGADDDFILDSDDLLDASPSSSFSSSTSSPSSSQGSLDDGAPPLYSLRVPGARLRFDWTWLSAARQVVERNLHDLLLARHPTVLRALLSLEGLRACSAPGLPAGDEARDAFAPGEGWDWAGVEGQWRRCVCWLDYRELIANNMRGVRARFTDADLSEVMRIIPFTLRVAAYAPAAPQWPGRPPILVEGEIAAGPEGAARRVHGRVEMVRGDDVRWLLFSERDDGDGHWKAEGAQLGGLGSATGVVGMWTGAEHEHMDPLGPFWAWKVGPTDGPVEGKALQLRSPTKEG
ncbi:hypothetical protein DENSPDRAFT_509164 [Dentipellis sp. KUC8613]|nr:hypothetical protein DENSPDRAFT_509164 [Dentipellis sp. KUC8613]